MKNNLYLKHDIYKHVRNTTCDRYDTSHAFIFLKYLEMGEIRGECKTTYISNTVCINMQGTQHVTAMTREVP